MKADRRTRLDAVEICGRARGTRSAVVHEADAPALSVRDLSVSYAGRIAVSGISFDVEPGVRVAIVGPNGAGKSTLLKAIAGLLPPSSGRIEVHGHVPEGHLCIAYVPQENAVDWRFPVTVTDVVSMGRIGRLGPLRRLHAADRDIVRHALDVVNLIGLADRRIDALSGGERQRMFIARALAQEAELVLMDEPLAGLDVNAKRDVVETLEGFRRSAVTLLVALHDLGLAASHFDRALMLRGRMLGFGRPSDVFTPETLEQAYGSCLRMVPTEDGSLVVQDTACPRRTP